MVAGACSALIVWRSCAFPISIAAKSGGSISQAIVARDTRDAGQSANRPKRAPVALPAMRARPRRGITSPTRSRGVTLHDRTVRRAGADEQGRDHRGRPDLAGAGSYPGSAGRRIASFCNGLLTFRPSATISLMFTGCVPFRFGLRRCVPVPVDKRTPRSSGFHFVLCFYLTTLVLSDFQDCRKKY